MKPENNTNADFCVCCGRPVPEGRMVCPSCELGNFEIAPKKPAKPAKGVKKLFGLIKGCWNGPTT